MAEPQIENYIIESGKKELQSEDFPPDDLQKFVIQLQKQAMKAVGYQPDKKRFRHTTESERG